MTKRTGLLLIGAAMLLVAAASHDRLAPRSIVEFAQSPSVLLDAGNSYWNEQAPAEFRVRFETTKGRFTIEAHRWWAPRGVDRFYDLVRAGFFDDSRFFRVRAGFIVQFGIPGDPKVASVWKDRAMPDDPEKQSNVRGTVAYAMTGPNTRTTQLYVNLADNSRLDAQGFAPIGMVSEGMEVIDRLYSAYGEQAGGGMRGGKQQKVLERGNAYLDREFPLLDRLIQARYSEH
ncbi:MAG TPA: peptidylprolyl isomerase [Blastocatellia bacterium]|nr:peptidylprolyl isomerase [Blastocatellia bacterium]